MNDIKIYEQVAKKPGIRASEIAVNLDLTLTTVSADLRSLVDAGDLVKSTKFGEQGRKCQVYALSDNFKASRTYKALMETMALTPAAEPVPTQTGTVAHDQEQPAVAPPAAQQHGPSPTKVQLALTCITRLGAATDDQLRDAMALPPKTYVGAYLASAVKAGKVVRDGDRWKLGAGKAEAVPKVLDSVEQVGNIVVATKDASPIPQAVVDAIVDAPAQAAVPTTTPAPAAQLTTPKPKPSRCRVAVWSDGQVEIKVPGLPSLELSRTEFEEVVRFVEYSA